MLAGVAGGDDDVMLEENHVYIRLQLVLQIIIKSIKTVHALTFEQ